LQGVQPLSVTIRASSATRQITNAWRLMWQGVAYNIRAIAPDERGVFLNLMAEADQSDA
jgi:head-tail adaptor